MTSSNLLLIDGIPLTLMH